MIARLIRISILNARKGGSTPRGSFFLLNDSWRRFKLNSGDLERQEVPGIYKVNYWVSTNKVLTDVEIGVENQRDEKLKEEEFIKKFKEKFKLDGDLGIIFTDGSKQLGNISTGVGIVISVRKLRMLIHRYQMFRFYRGTNGSREGTRFYY